jgi:YggT family protein
MLVALFIARLALQLTRANFRNPVAQGMLRLTNWLVMPLRKVLPPVGKLDLASVVAIILIETAGIVVLAGVRGFGIPSAPVLTGASLLGCTVATVDLWCLVVFVYALLSMVAPGGNSPLQGPLASIAEPLLRPVRRLLPVMGGFDFSPVVVIIGLQAIRILLIGEWPLLASLML